MAVRMKDGEMMKRLGRNRPGSIIVKIYTAPKPEEHSAE